MSRPTALRTTPRQVLAYLLPIDAAWALLVMWPLGRIDGSTYLTVNVLVAVAFCATGAFLAADPQHRVTAWAMVAAGFVWPLNWVNEWMIGPLPLIAELVGPLALLLVAWALLRYPVRWSGPAGDLVTGAVLALAQLAAFTEVVVSVPAWHHMPDSTPWPTVSADPVLFRIATDYLYDGGGGLVAAVAICLFGLRYRRLRGLDRLYMRPVLLAVVVASAATVVSNGAHALQPDPGVLIDVYLVQSLSLLAIPFAFLAATARRHLATEREIPLLIERIRRATSAADLQAVLRDGLRDPSLVVAYRVDASPEVLHVDPDGEQVSIEPARAVPLTIDGRTIGAVVTDAASWRNRHVVGPVVRATELVAQNTRLEPQILTLIDVTTRSAARLHALISTEIQHISHEVHSGPVRRIEHAAALLDELAALPHRTDSRLSALAVEARAAAHKLTDLAADRLPPVLVSHGLGAALAEFDHPLLTVEIEDRRYPPNVEEAVWFVVAELVTNAHKHAPDASVTVRQVPDPKHLHIDVVDNGGGGADPQGSGLRGLALRARSVGGSITIETMPIGGTRASLRVPMNDDRNTTTAERERRPHLRQFSRQESGFSGYGVQLGA